MGTHALGFEEDLMGRDTHLQKNRSCGHSFAQLSFSPHQLAIHLSEISQKWTLQAQSSAPAANTVWAEISCPLQALLNLQMHEQKIVVSSHCYRMTY